MTRMTMTGQSTRATVLDIGGIDVPGDVSTTVTLPIGTAVDGDISSVNDTDWFKVTLTAGQTYAFALNGSGTNALSDPYLSIYQQNYANVAVSLVSNDNSGAGNNAFLTFKAPTTGVYYIAAADRAWDLGHYTLNSSIVPADLIPDNATTTATLTVGQAVSGIATGDADSDWYAVQLTAGQTYEFNLVGTASGGLAAMDAGNLNVFSYDGSVHYLASSSYQPFVSTFSPSTSETHAFFTPTTSGTYYVAASSGGANYGGDTLHTNGGGYTAGYVQAPDDIDASGPVTASVGTSVSSLLATPGDVDTFYFDLVAGQTYLFHLDATGDSPITSATLNVNGQAVSGGIGDSTPTTPAVTFTPTVSGTYTVTASGFGGTYTLASQIVPSADVAGDRSTTATLSIGSHATGYVEDQGDKDWYAVQLTAGQTYHFQVSDLYYTFPTPAVSLYGATGALVAKGAAGGYLTPSDLVYTAKTSGTFYVQASFAAGWPYGYYTVKAEVPADAQGQTAATAQGLALDHVVHGEVDFSGDKDWFALNVVSGYTYDIGLVSTGDQPLQYPALQVVNAAGVTQNGSFVTTSSSSLDLYYTATTTGTVYVSAGTNQGFESGSYAVKAHLLDSISAGVDTTASLAVGQSFSSTIDFGRDQYGYGHDTDWIAVNLQAGQSYVYTVTGSGAVPTSPVINGLYDIDGRGVLSGPDISAGDNQHQQFYATTSGTYYIAVSASDPSQLGGYTLSLNTTNDIFDQTNSRTSLAIGATLHSAIGTASDQDWVKVILTAGQSYMFTVTGEGSHALGQAGVSLYGSTSNSAGIFASSASGPTPGVAEMRYTATWSGTYYVIASGSSGAVGDYSMSVSAVAPQNPLATIDSGHTLNHAMVAVYFAGFASSFGGHVATTGWTQAQIATFLAAANTWSKVANVTFVAAPTAASADMVAVLDSSVGAGTFVDAAGAQPNVFALNPATVLIPGGTDYLGVLNATGHVLGLTSPAGWTPTHEPLEGLYTYYGYGTANLNQNLYTVMSSTPPTNYGGYSGIVAGTALTPMALDIAEVQAKYGVVANATDDTTYSLPAADSGFQAIWDTGGIDTIKAGDDIHNVVIDLRPATLTGTIGAGGFLSMAYGVRGGFTIAAGTVIENATGGAQNDVLTGNDANNILTGGAGDDVLIGGPGDDTLIGGDGIDAASFAYATTGIAVDLGLAAAQDTHQGMDTLSGIENVYGSDYDDIVKVGTGSALIDGGKGKDTLVFSGNFADYTLGGSGYDLQFVSTTSTVTFRNIELFQFADKTIDFDHLIDDAPYITGDRSAFVTPGGSYTLTPDDLYFTDPDNASVVFTVVSQFLGAVLVNGVAATSFTDAQLSAGQVSFRQTGDASTNNYLAGFSISASDGQLTEGNGFPQFVSVRVLPAPGKVVLGGAAGDTLTGTASSDALYGGGGDDLIIGLGGGDMLDGGIGVNTVSYAGASASVTAALNGYGDVGASGYHDTLLNFTNLTGSSFNDQLTGDIFNNILDGGIGADTLTGDYGDDTYLVENASDIVVELSGQGIDTVMASVSYTLGANVEKLILSGTADLNAFGNNIHNTLTGNSGNNVLDGREGPDTLIGGAGNDSYSVENVGDVVIEAANEGIDTVKTNLGSYILGANVENLILTGSANSAGTGNGLANVLTGNGADNILSGGKGNDTLAGGAGNDALDGGEGADRMLGGVGNDSYSIENTGDVVVELANEGIDTIKTNLGSYVLTANVENLILTGSAAINGTGNELDNSLTGNGGNNILLGGKGNDILQGGLGDDYLDGGTGGDKLYGGAGNDTYLYGSGDTIVEAENGGTDTVLSAVTSMTLGYTLENVSLVGNALNADGNNRDNVMNGNALANILRGGQGNDVIRGMGGNDTLDGGKGNDAIDGGAGNDTMTGGSGNDTFYVDSAADSVVEKANEGTTDTVRTTLSGYVLAANVENLVLLGAADLNGSGNALDNILTGNSGHNQLAGGLGADTFRFLAGSGVDTILDFQASQNDRIDLHAYNAQATTVITQIGADTTIDLGGGNIITVLNTTVADLTGHIVW